MLRLLSRSMISFVALFFWQMLPAVAQNFGELGELLATYRFEGRVVSAQRAQVSTTTNGLLVGIHFAQGDMVEQGQVLFELGEAGQRLNFQTAQIAVARRTAELGMAQVEADRVSVLFERGTATETARTASEHAVTLAQANLDDAEVQLAGTRIQLAQTRILAPISGFIDGPNVALGTFLKTDTDLALAQITQLDPVLVAFKQPYVSLLELSNSSPLKLTELFEHLDVVAILPTGEIYLEPGRLLHTASSLDEDGETVTVWAEFPNPDFTLVQGLRVGVQIELSE